MPTKPDHALLIGNPMVFRQLPLEMALEKTAALGFDGVELWPPQIKECRTATLRRALARRLDSLHLRPVRLNCADMDYFSMLRSPDDVPRALEGLRADIAAACDLGMRQLLSWEGRPAPGLTASGRYGWVLDETTRLFEQALAYARPHGVSLFVEVHPFTLGIDIEWLLKLCDRLGEGFGVLCDFCHFGVGLPDRYVPAIRRLGPRIRHLHVSDSDLRSSELHFAPGSGCLDLDGILAALRETGFHGTAMLDLWLYPFPEEGARVGVPYLGQVLKELGLGVP